MNIDATIELRRAARSMKDWAESDRLRSLLRSHGVIVRDTPCGHQDAIHLPAGITPDQWEDMEAMRRRADANFDSWLYRIKNTTNTQR